MRIPIPTVQRQIDPRPANAGPMASGVPSYGVENLGASLFNVGANMQQAANVEADRAAREAAAKLERSEHEQRKNRVMERSRDDRLKWQETMQQRQTEAPEGADGFTASALKDFDTYRDEALKSVTDPEERAMYDGMLGSLREHVGAQALVFQAGARTAYRAKSLTEGVEKSARLVTVDPSQMPDVLTQELALIRTSSDLTAEQKATLAERAKDTLSWAAAQTLVDRNPDAFLERVGVRGGKPGKDGTPPKQDIEKAAAAVQGDAVLSQLPPQRLQQAIERATMLSMTRQAARDAERDRAAARAEAAMAARERRAETMNREAQALALSGTLSADYVNQLVEATRGTASQPAVQQLLTQQRESGALAAQPLAVQRATLDAVDADIAKNGTSPEREKRRNQIEAVVRSTQTEVAKDDVRAYLARAGGAENIAPLSFDAGLQGLAPQLAARRKLAEDVTAFTGKPSSGLFPEEVDTLRTFMDAQPAKQRAAIVAEMAGALGPRPAQGLAAQLAPKDAALGLAFGYSGSRTTTGRLTSELILAGRQAQKDGTSTKAASAAPQLKPAQWEAHMAAELAGVYPSQAQTDATREAAVLIAHGIAAEQGGQISSDDLDRAARLAAGGTFADYNGRRVFLPAGTDEDMLNKRLGTVTAAELAKQGAGEQVRAGGAMVPTPEFVKTLRGQQLQYMGGGRYAVIVSGRPVVNAAGVPVLIGLQ